LWLVFFIEQGAMHYYEKTCLFYLSMGEYHNGTQLLQNICKKYRSKNAKVSMI